MAGRSKLDKAIADLAQAPDVDLAKTRRHVATDLPTLLPQILAWIDKTILERWLALNDQDGSTRLRLRVGNRRLYQLDGSVRAGLMASANDTLSKGLTDPQGNELQEVRDWIAAAASKAARLTLEVQTNTENAPHSVGVPCALLAQAWGQDEPQAMSFDGPDDPIAALLEMGLVQRQIWVLFEGDTVVSTSDRRGAEDLAAIPATARHALLAANRAPGLSVIGQIETDGISTVAAFSNQKHLVLMIKNADLPDLLSAWQGMMAQG